MKIFKIFLIFVSLILGVSGCTKTDTHPEQVFVTFKDYDNTVLYHTKIDYGTSVQYEGELPTRDMTEDKVYTFTGWDKNIDEKIYDNTIFSAQYTEELRKYIVTFLNYDGTLLQTLNVEYGKLATYSGSTPIKNSDDEHVEYEFNGWDKDISNIKIKQDTIFIAKFKTVNYVFASFYNYDDTLLLKSKILKGTTPVYNGSTPTRNYDGDDKVYKFKSWDKMLKNIDIDTSYNAIYDLLNIYTVTFKNYNNTVLLETKVIQGETAKYTGSTPYKPSYTSGRYTYTYTFVGWSSSLDNVQRSYTVTAQFEENVTYEYTDEEKVINHLNKYGSGTYDYVSTGEGTTLGYSSGKFYLSYSNDSSLNSDFVMNFKYDDSYGYALFQIYDGNTLMFKAYFYVYFSSHKFGSMSCDYIVSTYYTTDQQLEMVAALSLLAAQMSVNNASTYLNQKGLPYVF